MNRESFFEHAISIRLAAAGIKRLFFIFILLLAYSVHGYAGTYYVSPRGTASWPACTTSSNPCPATIAMSNAAAGDTVLFLAGTYATTGPNWSTPGYNPAHSGTNGNPITFKSNPGDTVTIVPTGTGGNPLIGAAGRNYIVWDGFVVDTSTMADLGTAVIFTSSSNCVIKNSTLIGHTGHTADNNALLRLQSSTYILIQNNTIKNQRGADVDSAGIQNFYSSNCTIEYNEVYNCNTAFDEKNSASPAYVQTYRYNLIHDCDTGVHGPGNASTNILDIYQNIFYNIATCVLDIEKDWPNSYFRNNTIYNYGRGIGFWSIVTSASSLSVYNNIFHTNGSNYVITYHNNGMVYDNYNNDYNSGSGISFELNYNNTSYSSWKSQTGFDVNSITTDPLFVNASSHDFHLQNGSPALTKGRGGSYPSVMGAYISGNEIIGRTSSTTSSGSAVPSAPVGLSVQ